MKKILPLIIVLTFICGLALADTNYIIGSNAYDITLSLEEMGWQHAERKKGMDGYEFSGDCKEGNTYYTFYILSEEVDGTYPIKYAYFTFLGKENGFLHFITSIPYDTADMIKSVEVVDNLEMVCEVKVGDATFYYSPVGVNGGMLEIASEAYDWMIMR